MLKTQKVACIALTLTTISLGAIVMTGCTSNETPTIRAEQSSSANSHTGQTSNQTASTQIRENATSQITQLSDKQDARTLEKRIEKKPIKIADHLANAVDLGPQRFMPGKMACTGTE